MTSTLGRSSDCESRSNQEAPMRKLPVRQRHHLRALQAVAERRRARCLRPVRNRRPVRVVPPLHQGRQQHERGRQPAPTREARAATQRSAGSQPARRPDGFRLRAIGHRLRRCAARRPRVPGRPGRMLRRPPSRSGRPRGSSGSRSAARTTPISTGTRIPRSRPSWASSRTQPDLARARRPDHHDGLRPRELGRDQLGEILARQDLAVPPHRRPPASSACREPGCNGRSSRA